MKVLKKISSRIGYKLVGVTIPPKTYSYIALQCSAQGITIATLLRNLLASWMETEKKKNPDEKLLQGIIKRLQREINLERRRNPDVVFDLESFRDTVEAELLEKGIIPAYVETIVNELE
jgi:hypothetical protein